VALREDLVRAYRQTLADLLPEGIAWRKDEDSNLSKLLRAYAIELALFDVDARGLLAESDPREAFKLLDEWERFLGLPSPCTGPLEDIGPRRNAIVAKLTREASASIPFLEDYAARLGYEAEVLEFRSARMGGGCGDELSNVQVGCRMGSSGAGDRLENAIGWAHTWALRSNGATTTYARMGESGAGDALRLIGNELLECSVLELNPAHATVLFFFFYAIDPTPARVELAAPTPTL
jgi:uncharacterized protein YmfQ (DUF2313 family)